MQKNEYENYFAEMNKMYKSEEELKILIIKAAVMIYPLVAEMDGGISKPIAIIAESKEKIQQIFSQIRGFSPNTLDLLLMNKNEIKKIYTENEYEQFLILYQERKKCRENFQYVVSLNEVTNWRKTILFVGFCGGVPSECFEDVTGQIYVEPAAIYGEDRMQKEENVARFLLRYIEQRQHEIFAKLYNIDDSVENWNHMKTAGEKLFVMAQVILKKIFHEICVNPKERYERESLLDKITERMLCDFEITENYDDMWEEQFQNLLKKSSDKIFKAVDRNRMYARDIERIDELLIYDSQFYYLSENLLREICESWLEGISFSNLRNVLTNAGIIVTEGRERRYYTVKLSIVTEYGGIIYPRVVKIPRNKIDRYGELSLYEMLSVEENLYDESN